MLPGPARNAANKRSDYDVAIAYRIYPRVSKPSEGLISVDDKFQLASICLSSLKASLGDLRVKIWVLLDGCPDSYAEMFQKHFSSEDLILLPLGGEGNHATFSRQIDILLQQNESRFIYFAEDDYFYHSGQFREMLEFLKDNPDVDFISPYDHPDCYNLKLHQQPRWIRPYKNRHWRTAGSTCLTFLSTKEALASCEKVFRSYAYGNDDCALWLSLTKMRIFNMSLPISFIFRGQFYWKIFTKAWFYCWTQILFGRRKRLWVPVPAIATHLDKNALSPCTSWTELMQTALVSTDTSMQTFVAS